MSILNYVYSFIFGGLLVSIIKYLANTVSPVYAAVVASVPIGLVSSYVIKEKNTLYKYLNAYIKSLVVLFLSGVLNIILINYDFSNNIALGLSLLAWLIMSIIKVLLNK